MITQSKTSLRCPKLLYCLFKTSHKSPRIVLVINVDQFRDICDLGQILVLTPINSLYIGFNSNPNLGENIENRDNTFKN